MATAFTSVGGEALRTPLATSRRREVLPINLANLEPVYSLTGQGDCLHPVVEDGAILVFDQRLPVAPGDVVGLVFTPATARSVGLAGMVKRLAQPLPPPGVIGLVVVEMLNPPRRLTFRTDELQAVHRCVGFAEVTGPGRAIYKPSQTPPRIEQECGR